MIALVFSPLLVSLSVAVGVGLPGIGLYYELAYRRDRRRQTSNPPIPRDELDDPIRRRTTESA